MGGLDLKKMREQQKNISNSAGSGDDKKFIYAEKLKAEEFVKGMPDLVGSLNGGYYVEQIVWWVNGKLYLSNQTFNEDCVMQAEFDKAEKLAETDKEMKAILTAKNPKNKAPLLQRSTRYLLPVLHLNLEFDPHNEEQVENVSVIDDMVKVIVMKPKLMDDYHRVITSKTVNKKGGWGAMEQETGAIIQIGKEGSGLDTTYYAQLFEKMEDDEVWDKLADPKFYTTEAIPNVMKMTEGMRKSDEYLRGVMRAYLYGEEMPNEEKSSKDGAASDDEEEEETTKAETTKIKKPTVTKQEAEVKESDEQEETGRTGRRRTSTNTSKVGGSRNLIDDVEEELNNLD